MEPSFPEAKNKNNGIPRSLGIIKDGRAPLLIYLCHGFLMTVLLLPTHRRVMSAVQKVTRNGSW